MAKKEYDRILTRLMMILTKLNDGERPTKRELEKEFNVGAKTIERDIYSRLQYFDIKKDRSGCFYFEEGFSLARGTFTLHETTTLLLSMDLIKSAGTDFRASTKSILAKALYPSVSSAYYIKPTLYEEIDMDSKIVDILEEAVLEQKLVMIIVNYNKRLVEPYKIINVEGIWYLLAFERNTETIKTFMMSKIQTVEMLEYRFKIPDDLEETIDDVVSGYFNDMIEFDVVIQVKKNISDYFRLRKQLPSQEILETLQNGDLLVKYTITHIEDIDNIIKSWLPDIEVIEPTEFRDKIREELLEYLNKRGFRTER